MPVSLDTETLLSRIEEGLEGAASRGRRTLVSATAEVPELDPSAVAFATRLASDRWFCWEQPDRGFALAAIGSAHEVVSRGERRFAEVAEGCLALARDRVSSGERELPAGAGPVWTGAFAFDPEGGGTPVGRRFRPP